MNPRGAARRCLCTTLVLLLAAPAGASQLPAGKPAVPEPAGATLTIAILEGNNVINSISLLRSNAPIVEIRDQNEFPVEAATVVFTLPAEGPGGTFPGGGKTFSTRSDSHGQAAAPLFTPQIAGQFEIKVTASSGNRKAEAVVKQTNSMGDYAGPPLPKKPVYKKRTTLFLAAGAVAAAVVGVVLLTRKSSSPSTSTTTPTTITITPGSPIFH